MRFLLIVLFIGICTAASAQEPDSVMLKRAKAIAKDSLNAQDSTNMPKKESNRDRRKREKQEKEDAEAKANLLKDSARLAIENVSRTAVRRSLILPGWGQVYNAQQWHLRKAEMKEKGIVSPKLWWLSVPVIYGGFVSVGLMFEFNNRYYHIFLEEVQYRLANNGEWLNEEYRYINQEYAIQVKDFYRRNRDLSILIALGVYTINVIEAYVNSMFMRYDIRDDLSFNITPTLQQIPGRFALGSFAPGIKLTFAMR